MFNKKFYKMLFAGTLCAMLVSNGTLVFANQTISLEQTITAASEGGSSETGGEEDIIEVTEDTNDTEDTTDSVDSTEGVQSSSKSDKSGKNETVVNKSTADKNALPKTGDSTLYESIKNIIDDFIYTLVNKVRGM